MRHLLNTLFVTSEDIYLSLDGENVVASREHQEAARYPLHTLSGIISFSYPGASPALMGACAEHGISLAFCTPRGRFLARIAGSTSGNVLLRRVQYRTADELSASCRIARSMIFGKVYNARWSIERTRRDHGLRLDSASLTASASHLKELLPQIAAAASLEHLRGLEGAGATLYFGQFDQLILGEKPLFSYQSRSRRPPRDPVNALLSFVYSLLSHDCASALESVGLDSYVGFLHRDRPGRASLALDLMEELRPCMADRFVLTLINNRMVGRQDFDFLENGAVFLSDSGRRAVLKRWQERKKEPLTHPYLQDLKELLPQIAAAASLEHLRGLEGAGATLYFGQFDQLILGEKPLFSYQSRSRRPPRDPVNALLSFVYSLLSHDCASALESVGLDSYVGFLHRDRPGRASLALDLMEELRPCMADRFVLTLINNRIVGRQDFDFLENGAVFLSDSGRRAVLKRWQERKKESLTHPYLQEKLSWGLVPYLQALLLARCLRGDLDAYPPFLWK